MPEHAGGDEPVPAAEPWHPVDPGGPALLGHAESQGGEGGAEAGVPAGPPHHHLPAL